MTNKKTTAQPRDEASETSFGVGSQTEAGEGLTTVFRDTVYTSRTLILPDGSAVPVVAGKIAATSDELLTYLTAEADFEPLPR